MALTSLFGAVLSGGPALAQGPSFSCAQASSSVERLVCADQSLSDLDRKLAEVFVQAAATRMATADPVTLKAEQRGWIKGRDDCWKSKDMRGCVEQLYQDRIVELQARYGLVAAEPPIVWVCDGDAKSLVTVRFFDTDPPTLIAERGGRSSLMYGRSAASGARYEGQNTAFWEHHGEAAVVWGVGAPEMTCRPLR
ncbi:hypothetical protein TSO352_07670 [Azospirillum sp. TSO35-2]|nr:hypothetical protein TSO352_07670 [Azospirillum sp. TSO35-2]